MAGQHAHCIVCVLAKKELKKHVAAKRRAEDLECDCAHLLDRQVDVRHMISLSCSVVYLSHLVIRIDGVGQAKFRIPRVLTKTHALGKLTRPALHVQGACGTTGATPTSAYGTLELRASPSVKRPLWLRAHASG